MSHDRTAFGTAPWPYSGRGERRPQTACAHRTNSPLELPATLRGKGETPEGRRWRDLVRHWGNKLGPQCLRDEGTRAKLLNLVWMTLELEAMRDADAVRRPPASITSPPPKPSRTCIATCCRCSTHAASCCRATIGWFSSWCCSSVAPRAAPAAIRLTTRPALVTILLMSSPAPRCSLASLPTTVQ